MYTRTRIELFGGLRIAQGDRIITRYRTQKTGALLAYLAYFRERCHPRELLIELLWPEADPSSGRNALSIALSSLRHQLEPPGVPHGAILRADRFAIQLNPEAASTDVAEFDAALQKAEQAGSTSERILFLSDAAALYTGELLPGYYEDWCLTERERLAGTYLGALHQLAELLERTDDLDRALSYARRAVSADPLGEQGTMDVMRLLAAAGQPTAALRQYRELEQRLDEQLGEAPSAATRQLARDIERQTAGVTDKPVRSTSAAAPLSSALPARLPMGTVTFLLTDIEGSTARWKRSGEAFTAALASHHALLRRAFHRLGGYEAKETGDGFLVAFERAGDALSCAVAGQRSLADHPWPEEVGPLPVRMALHTGDVEVQEGDYHGFVLHHASRMLAAGHGGQILCSEATAAVAQRSLEPGVRLAELGVYRLRDLETPERLFQIEYRDMAQRMFPPLRAEAGYAGSLPLQFTRFVGREEELQQIEALLLADQTRLVTLTGPGGTGKSRLALELTGRLSEHFSGAVWFVPLADLSDPRLILDAVLEALRLPRTSSDEPLEQVAELLSRQPSLLLLDNFEQLAEDGAPVVRTLLERVPSLKCLVTSRQQLGLSSEREFVVPPLKAPTGAGSPEQLSMYESVQLFIDRAQAVKPDFQVTRQNAPAVAELCRRLEGIPLAIELAAARAQILTPVQMVNQLSRRFDFLVSRRRDSAKRHQTLYAAVDWGYRLLSPDLKRFFARLSVFRGGWTLAAAEAVCEEPLALDYLAELRECSFVLAQEEGEETRFRMLETLREFAQECLTASGETEAVHRQHAHFFLDLAQAEADRYEYQGSDPEFFLRLTEAPESLLVEPWVALMEREDHNLRAARGWAQASEERDLEGRLEGVIHYSPLNRVPLVIIQQAIVQGASEIRLEPGAELVGIRFRIDGEWREVLRLPKSVQCRLIARFKLMTDMKVEVQNVPQEGKLQASHWEKEYDLPAHCQPTPHGEEMAIGIVDRVVSEQDLAVWRETGGQQTTILSLIEQASVARTEGDRTTAHSLLRECLRMGRELGSKPHVALGLVAWGCVEVEEGRMERAARLFGAQGALRRGLPLPPTVQVDYERQAAAARAALGDSAFRAAIWEGDAMTLDEAIAYALKRCESD